MAWKKPPSQVYYIGCLFYPSFLAPCSSREVLQKAIPSNTRYGNHRELFSWLPMGKYLLMGISARNAVSTLTRRPAVSSPHHFMHVRGSCSAHGASQTKAAPDIELHASQTCDPTATQPNFDNQPLRRFQEHRPPASASDALACSRAMLPRRRLTLRP